MLRYVELGAEVVFCILDVLKDGSSVWWDAEESFAVIISVRPLKVCRKLLVWCELAKLVFVFLCFCAGVYFDEDHGESFFLARVLL